MLVLRNFESFNDFFDLESRKNLPYKDDYYIVGCYKLISNNNIVFIYEINNDKYIGLNDIVHKIDEDSSVRLIKVNDKINRILLYQNHIIILEFNYEHDRRLFNVPPFEYLDEEDFDWGLYIMNFLNVSM
jgi:hypothetical protein